jgi:hypothetical protein
MFYSLIFFRTIPERKKRPKSGKQFAVTTAKPTTWNYFSMVVVCLAVLFTQSNKCSQNERSGSAWRNEESRIVDECTPTWGITLGDHPPNILYSLYLLFVDMICVLCSVFFTRDAGHPHFFKSNLIIIIIQTHTVTRFWWWWHISSLQETWFSCFQQSPFIKQRHQPPETNQVCWLYRQCAPRWPRTLTLHGCCCHSEAHVDVWKFESKFTMLESFALLVAGFIQNIAVLRVKNKNCQDTPDFKAEVNTLWTKNEQIYSSRTQKQIIASRHTIQ